MEGVHSITYTHKSYAHTWQYPNSASHCDKFIHPGPATTCSATLSLPAAGSLCPLPTGLQLALSDSPFLDSNFNQSFTISLAFKFEPPLRFIPGSATVDMFSNTLYNLLHWWWTYIKKTKMHVVYLWYCLCALCVPVVRKVANCMLNYPNQCKMCTSVHQLLTPLVLEGQNRLFSIIAELLAVACFSRSLCCMFLTFLLLLINFFLKQCCF